MLIIHQKLAKAIADLGLLNYTVSCHTRTIFNTLSQTKVLQKLVNSKNNRQLIRGRQNHQYY
ncbi:MAG: hypothetical protein V7K35_00820 [Nostoc sp.]